MTQSVTVGGLPIGTDEPGITGGFAARLDKPAELSFKHAVGTATISLTHGSDIVVVRLADPACASADQVLRLAYPAIQEALDVFGARRAYWHDVPEAWARHLTWWHDSRGVVVRWSDFSEMTVRNEVSWVINRGDGSSESSEDAPLPPWREVWRYLRYSQTATDLYDGYRTAYLAFESMLSLVHPKTERLERDWLMNGLAELVNLGVDLQTFVSASAPDPVKAFHDEQYKAHRCAQEHAKLSRPRFLPGTLDDRELVAEALLNLASLVVHAMRTVDKFGSGVGVTTFAGIRHTASVSQNMTLHVTSDGTPVDKADVAISPAGRPTTRLQTQFLDVVDTHGYDFGWLGECLVADLAEPLVQRTAGTVVDDLPGGSGGSVLMVAGDVPPLDTTGADVLQYMTAMVWTHNGGLRRHYPRA